MSILEDSAINATNLETPLVGHLVEVTESDEVVVDLSQQSLGRYNYEGLWSADLVVFVFVKLLSCGRDVFERVEDRDEVGESFSCSVVGVDDDAEVFEIILESDGEGLCLNQCGFIEVVLLEKVKHFVFNRVVLELGLSCLGSQVVLLRLFYHLIYHFQSYQSRISNPSQVNLNPSQVNLNLIQIK